MNHLTWFILVVCYFAICCFKNHKSFPHVTRRSVQKKVQIINQYSMDTGDLTEHKQTQLYPVLKSLSFVVLNIYEVDT